MNNGTSDGDGDLIRGGGGGVEDCSALSCTLWQFL